MGNVLEDGASSSDRENTLIVVETIASHYVGSPKCLESYLPPDVALDIEQVSGFIQFSKMLQTVSSLYAKLSMHLTRFQTGNK